MAHWLKGPVRLSGRDAVTVTRLLSRLHGTSVSDRRDLLEELGKYPTLAVQRALKRYVLRVRPELRGRSKMSGAHSEEGFSRLTALDALVDMGGPGVEGVLLMAIRDPYWMVRMSAARHIRLLLGKQAVRPLRQALQMEPVEAVRVELLRDLFDLTGEPHYLDAILTLVFSDAQGASEHAVRVLSYIPGRKMPAFAMRMLRLAWRSERRPLRKRALRELLDDLRDPRRRQESRRAAKVAADLLEEAGSPLNL